MCSATKRSRTKKEGGAEHAPPLPNTKLDATNFSNLRTHEPTNSRSYAKYHFPVDERQFFTEKPEQRPARFQCPRCRRTNDYSIRWMRRTKKAQVPSGADARARAMFEKVKDHLVRIDDDVTCKTCGKRFEIPSHRALVFLEELEGLPQDVEEIE